MKIGTAAVEEGDTNNNTDNMFATSKKSRLKISYY